MDRLDVLRLSLLAGLTGCGTPLAEGNSDGQTTTSMGTDAGTEAGTSTGEDCSSDCDPSVATEIAEGILQCPDGRINRVGGGTFDPTISAPECMGTETSILCSPDEPCPGPNGKCISTTFSNEFEPYTACTCVSACASDDDCAEGSVCMPPGVLEGSPDWPTCVAVTCEANSDCGECGECGLAAHSDGCGWIQQAVCRSPEDTCQTDDDCETYSCAPFFGGPWDCAIEDCTAGRPLLVGARPCTAQARARDEWAAHPLADRTRIDELPADPELAAYWAKLAALEHASVASFARFGMQLLALGAPPRLLRACKQAALDEVEHAQLAYTLASAYARAPIGPGRLDLRGVELNFTWREVVGSLIVEACVGETLGVAEAMSAAAHARAPVLRDVLERIAADELRHAQLAWQSLQWLLSEADASERAWALALLERTIAELGRTRDAATPDRVRDGVVGGARRGQLHRDAGARVLTPLAHALAAQT